MLKIFVPDVQYYDDLEFSERRRYDWPMMML